MLTLSRQMFSLNSNYDRHSTMSFPTFSYAPLLWRTSWRSGHFNFQSCTPKNQLINLNNFHSHSPALHTVYPTTAPRLLDPSSRSMKLPVVGSSPRFSY